MASEQRYTELQVLELLRQFSDYRDESSISITNFADVSLGDYADWTWPTGDACRGFITEILAIYDVSASESELRFLAHGKTKVSEIARFIAERAEVRTLAPVRILGRTCLSAGLFRELERISARFSPRAHHVGPSTVIAQVLSKAEQASLIMRLSLTVPNATHRSDLWRRSPWSRIAGWSLFFVAVMTILAAVLVGIPTTFTGIFGGFLALAGCACVPVVILSCTIFAFADHFARSAFVPEVRTYRDLVQALLPVVPVDPPDVTISG